MNLSRLWGSYLRSLSRRPLLTQACSTGETIVKTELKTTTACAKFPPPTCVVCAGVISGVGDVLAQQLVEGGSPSSHDWSRTLLFSSVGFFFVVGTVLYYQSTRTESINHV